MHVNAADPRPDLTEDSTMWTRFLALAEKKYSALFEPLNTMRQNGTRLKKLNTGEYGLRPQVGEGCWSSNEVYRSKAAELLKPHHDSLVQLLKEFTAVISDELAGAPQWVRIRHALNERGICAVKSGVLNGEVIYFARDGPAAAGAPEKAVVYTLGELRQLVASPPDEAGLRQLHEAKKVFGGTIFEFELDI